MRNIDAHQGRKSLSDQLTGHKNFSKAVDVGALSVLIRGLALHQRSTFTCHQSQETCNPEQGNLLRSLGLSIRDTTSIAKMEQSLHNTLCPSIALLSCQAELRKDVTPAR